MLLINILKTELFTRYLSKILYFSSISFGRRNYCELLRPKLENKFSVIAIINHSITWKCFLTKKGNYHDITDNLLTAL